MFKAIYRFWYNLTAPRYWSFFGDPKTGSFRMKRWVGSGFEYRECTDEEADDARLDSAIK